MEREWPCCSVRIDEGRRGVERRGDKKRKEERREDQRRDEERTGEKMRETIAKTIASAMAKTITTRWQSKIANHLKKPLRNKQKHVQK